MLEIGEVPTPPCDSFDREEEENPIPRVSSDPVRAAHEDARALFLEAVGQRTKITRATVTPEKRATYEAALERLGTLATKVLLDGGEPVR